MFLVLFWVTAIILGSRYYCGFTMLFWVFSVVFSLVGTFGIATFVKKSSCNDIYSMTTSKNVIQMY